jgi:hypothetical protein
MMVERLLARAFSGDFVYCSLRAFMKFQFKIKILSIVGRSNIR